MAPVKKSSAAAKGKRTNGGLATPSIKRGRGRPRKYPAPSAATSQGRARASPKVGGSSGVRSGGSSRGGGPRRQGRYCDEEEHGMVARPARPRSRSVDVSLEFLVGTKRPAGTWLSIPRFFSRTLPPGLDGLWLQADGCCSQASWVSVEFSATGDARLTRGWQAFARARGLKGRSTLHFTYVSPATLFVRIFGAGGLRVGCCPEESGDDDDDTTSTSCGFSSEESAGAPMKREEGSY